MSSFQSCHVLKSRGSQSQNSVRELLGAILTVHSEHTKHKKILDMADSAPPPSEPTATVAPPSPSIPAPTSASVATTMPPLWEHPHGGAGVIQATMNSGCMVLKPRASCGTLLEGDPAAVAAFMRDAVGHMESALGILDFHFNFHDAEPGSHNQNWNRGRARNTANVDHEPQSPNVGNQTGNYGQNRRNPGQNCVYVCQNQSQAQIEVKVYHGSPHDKSEIPEYPVCISCDLDNAISRSTFIGETEHHRMWLDAQGRDKLIVTPKKHYLSLSDFSDAELLDFVLAIRRLCLDCRVHKVFSVIVNHGQYKNHAHIHAKINFEACNPPENIAAKMREVALFPKELLAQYVPVEPDKAKNLRGGHGYRGTRGTGSRGRAYPYSSTRNQQAQVSQTTTRTRGNKW
ncbi:hypothetical protein Pelo_2639 [Pelomyxa schiedti]|nr:hypothetical protein Pelo_2639 [Pelomyxa schiedti]